MAEKCRYFTRKNLDRLAQVAALPIRQQLAIKAVSAVLPFRVNRYVVDELIDWDNVDTDPMFRQAFPQEGMLSQKDFGRMLDLVRRDATTEQVSTAAREIQLRLNPHPAGQLELNVPTLAGKTVPGIQHKYRETVLFFPSQGQTCHAYCTYCFRWAQFVGIDELKFASNDAENLAGYLADHSEVNSVLFTGGDPMTMKARALEQYIEPLLQPGFEHIDSIRIGSKSLAYWPQRFVSDEDADDTLRLFERVVAAGKHLAFMAHFSHPRELSTPVVQKAIRRIQSTGAVVRSQAPLLRHINDSSDVWRDMWKTQVTLGIVPYYMFIARDTGPKEYFKVPIAHALELFNHAYSRISGLGRTVRGPSMSTTSGKVLVDGKMTVGGKRMLVLKMLQCRNPDWVGRTFLAEYDETAAWIDDLTPAFGHDAFFFDGESSPSLRVV